MSWSGWQGQITLTCSGSYAVQWGETMRYGFLGGIVLALALAGLVFWVRSLMAKRRTRGRGKKWDS
jgi:hypothetical protein